MRETFETGRPGLRDPTRKALAPLHRRQ